MSNAEDTVSRVLIHENARHAEYQARERRNNITMMAKRILVLQHGHHGALWLTNEERLAEQHELYRKMARAALSAASAFYEELSAFDSANPTTGHGEP